jgi:hypothetical protein
MNWVRQWASGSSPIRPHYRLFAWSVNTNVLCDFFSSPCTISIDFNREIGAKTEAESGISGRTFHKNGNLHDESMSVWVGRLTNLILDTEANSELVGEDEQSIERP